MPEAGPSGEGTSLELRAAALRLAAADRARFLDLLSDRLAVLVPGLVRVERGGLFGRGGIRSITVALPEERLVLAPSGAGLAGERHVVVHDIVVRRDRLELDAWVDALAAAVDAHADDVDDGGLKRLLDLG